MFSVNLINRDPQELFCDVTELLRNRAGVMPISEHVAASGHDAESALTSHENWNEIRKKTVRMQLFELFVLESRATYNLSWDQAVRFLSLIQLYNVCKIISAKDVSYRHGKIVSVDGISLFEGGFRFDRPFEGSVIDDLDHKRKDSVGRTVSDLWKKGTASSSLPASKRST